MGDLLHLGRVMNTPHLARLYEQAGKKAAALRHLSIYRRLTGEV